MFLCKLIKKICNGSTSVVVEYVLGNLVEDFHRFTLILGDEYDTLHKYMEASQHEFEVLKMAGFDVCS